MLGAPFAISCHNCTVTSGGCWAELEDGSLPPLRLAAGDIVVMPMGDAHVLCSTPGMRAAPNLDLY